MNKIILLSESGQFCPETGVWATEVQNKEGQSMLIERMVLQKDAFPTIDGKPAKWKLLLELN